MAALQEPEGVWIVIEEVIGTIRAAEELERVLILDVLDRRASRRGHQQCPSDSPVRLAGFSGWVGRRASSWRRPRPPMAAIMSTRCGVVRSLVGCGHDLAFCWMIQLEGVCSFGDLRIDCYPVDHSLRMATFLQSQVKNYQSIGFNDEAFPLKTRSSFFPRIVSIYKGNETSSLDRVLTANVCALSSPLFVDLIGFLICKTASHQSYHLPPYKKIP